MNNELRTMLILFSGELSYCLANKFPVGEGHTPPSYIYEAMEAKVDKWLASRPPIQNKTNDGGRHGASE